MKKNFKKILRITVLVLAMAPIAGFAHLIIFPQETKSILIEFSDFKKDGRLYFNPSSAPENISKIKSLIKISSARVAAFWGDQKSNPRLIYCEQAEDFRKYSVSPFAPAATYCKMGTYIILSQAGVDPDIIAHEISHAELYERVGFYIWTFKIPDWFKHGLAMQNDYRIYYSLDTLKSRTHDLRDVPDISLYETSAQFYSGTTEEIMLRYMAAKYMVAKWYTAERLRYLVEDLKDGKSFKEAFKNN